MFSITIGGLWWYNLCTLIFSSKIKSLTRGSRLRIGFLDKGFLLVLVGTTLTEVFFRLLFWGIFFIYLSLIADLF